MPSVRTIRKVADPEEMARVAADEFFRAMDEAGRRKGHFTVALSGGRTPRPLYELLASRSNGAGPAPAWHRTFIFTVDERRVPPRDPQNNFNLIYHTLMRPLAVPPRNVGRFFSEGPDTKLGAWVMEDRLKRHFKLAEGELPRFDLILLGMGEDGHTASLFPGTEALGETKRLAMANWVPGLNDYRFTMTPPVLNAARRVIFMVSGEEKAETLREVLSGPRQPEKLPAQIVEPADGSVLWIVDRDAAARLEGVE